MGQLASAQMKLEPTAAIEVLTIEPAGKCVISKQFKGRLHERQTIRIKWTHHWNQNL